MGGWGDKGDKGDKRDEEDNTASSSSQFLILNSQFPLLNLTTQISIIVNTLSKVL
ncbi:MAG: hypothetical protein F6J86_11775 [Symploca sp. SIO1B1]|nr:hypothetical protein [Symploca sp. SIO1B1]